MSRDGPESSQRREVEQSVETSGSATDAGDRTWGADFVPFGWPTLPSRSRNEGAAAAEQYDERPGTSYRDEYERGRTRERGRSGRRRGGMGDGTWADEGLITLLLVVGVGLFLFPEPGTSVIGMVLIGAGVLAWLVDLAT